MFYLTVADTAYFVSNSEYKDVSAHEFIDAHFGELFLPYISTESPAAAGRITFKKAIDWQRPESSTFKHNYYDVYTLDDRTRIVFSQPDPENIDQRVNTGIMDISPDYGNVTVYDLVGWEKRFEYSYLTLRYMLRVLFEPVLLLNGTPMFHGVAVEHSGRGIIFTAVSGTGKTTHADFWVENHGAIILNGDSPIINNTGEKPIIVSCPWCGSSKISVNKEVALDSVVVIKRGEANSIRRLSGFEAVGMLLSSIRYPAWDGNFVDIAFKQLERLCKSVNIFELTCLPEPEAAVVALDGIIGGCRQ